MNNIDGIREAPVKGVAIEVSEILLKEIDEMIATGYYHDRIEAVNDAVDQMVKQYKLSKLKTKEHTS